MAESKKGDVASRAKQRFRELQQRTEDDEEEVGIRDFSSLPLKPDPRSGRCGCVRTALAFGSAFVVRGGLHDFWWLWQNRWHRARPPVQSLHIACTPRGTGITPASICDVLDKLSKVKLPEDVRKYILQNARKILGEQNLF